MISRKAARGLWLQRVGPLGHFRTGEFFCTLIYNFSDGTIKPLDASVSGFECLVTDFEIKHSFRVHEFVSQLECIAQILEAWVVKSNCQPIYMRFGINF